MEAVYITFVILFTLIIFETVFPRSTFLVAFYVAYSWLIAVRYLLVKLAQFSGKKASSSLKEFRLTPYLKFTYKFHSWIYSVDEYLADQLVKFLYTKQEREMIQISQSQLQNKDEPQRYVPESDRDLPPEQQSVFYFKNLPRQKLLEEKDKLVKLNRRGAVSGYGINETRYRIALLRLVEWENIIITDEHGNRVSELEFDPSKKHELYELLPAELQRELEEEFGADDAEKARLEEEKEKMEEEEKKEKVEDDYTWDDEGLQPLD